MSSLNLPHYVFSAIKRKYDKLEELLNQVEGSCKDTQDIIQGRVRKSCFENNFYFLKTQKKILSRSGALHKF